MQGHIKRTSHEQRLQGWRRYVLERDGVLLDFADDPADLYKAAEKHSVSVRQREAWLSISGGDTNGTTYFEVTLFERGVQVSRHFTDEPTQARNYIEAWQGPLTDRRARYSVRGEGNA